MIAPLTQSGGGAAPRKRLILPAACLALLVLAALRVSAAPAAAGEPCPNEAIRAEQGSTALPDCRAYELVSPAARGDVGPIEGSHGFPDGRHLYFESPTPLPGARNGDYQQAALSTRTASGWQTISLTPPVGPGEPIGLNDAEFAGILGQVAFTADFTAAFVNSPFQADPLDQELVNDVYRIELPADRSSLASLPDQGPITEALTGSRGLFLANVSADGTHVLFQTQAQLPTAPGTPADTHTSGDELYDRTAGHTYLVGVLPDGSVPSCGAELGDGGKSELGQGQYIYGAISPDGSNVVFKQGYQAGCPEINAQKFPKIYLRENNETTVQLAGTSFAGRSADGSKVFTEGGDYQEGANGIYEYDVATGQTTTISPEGWFVAASADGSRVYYLIHSGPNAGLYLWEGGTAALISKPVGEGFASSARDRGEALAQADIAIATPDGSRLLFLDRSNLTSYDSFGPTCTEQPTPGPGECAEAYVYDASTNSIDCVSCNPHGAAPLGNVHLYKPNTNTAIPPYVESEISADGSRVFFQSPDPLVARDENDLPDIYEWEVTGYGSCTETSEAFSKSSGGCIYLISSGRGSRGAFFAGASSDGSDVFFVTPDRLAPQVLESSPQIYDARVDGGFPLPAQKVCEAETCKPSPSPVPAAPALGSPAFHGPGNGKSHHHRRRRHHLHHHRANRAGAKRGGSR